MLCFCKRLHVATGLNPSQKHLQERHAPLGRGRNESSGSSGGRQAGGGRNCDRHVEERGGVAYRKRKSMCFVGVIGDVVRAITKRRLRKVAQKISSSLATWFSVFQAILYLYFSPRASAKG
jgi:hypothetical protein